MPATDVIAFVRAALPPPPARVLEVGAGDGELAAALAAAGYDVVAIDPASEADGVRPVAAARARRGAVRRGGRRRLAAPRRAARRVAATARRARAPRRRAGDRRDRLRARSTSGPRAGGSTTTPTTPASRPTWSPASASTCIRSRACARRCALVRARRAGPRRLPLPLGHARRRARRGGGADRGRRAAGHGRAARRDQKTLSVRLRLMPPTCTVTRYLPRPRGRTQAS